MKKFIMTFLVAGLVITSVLSLSSCKKTDTNANVEEEWIPTTFNFVTNNGLTRDETQICPYCNYPVQMCDHGVNWWSKDEHGEQTVCPLGAFHPTDNPDGHYHNHCFEANDNCLYTGFDYCRYLGVRKHRHIVVLWQEGKDNHWHLGGGCNSYE